MLRQNADCAVRAEFQTHTCPMQKENVIHEIMMIPKWPNEVGLCGIIQKNEERFIDKTIAHLNVAAGFHCASWAFHL